MANSKYRAFAKVAELGSITRAAGQLGYTQSGVSHLVATLEEDLGVGLLVRSKSGTTLTEEGKALLPYINRILEAEQDLKNKVLDIRGLSTGNLRIGTFSSVAIHWLPGLLSGFKARYPGVEISVVNGDYAQVEGALLQGSVDCGFVTSPSRKEFSVQRLMRDRLLAVVPESSSLSGKETLEPRDLAEETFIVPAEGSDYQVGEFLARVGVPPRARLDINDDYAAVEMVRRQLGVTILPELMVQNLPLEGLCTIPLTGSEREIGLAVRRDRYLSPAVRAFLACAEEMICADGKC